MREWARRLLGYDTETAGLGDDARILEFGAVLIEAGKVVASWQILLNPPGINWRDPSVMATLEGNDLSLEDLRGKKTFAQEFSYIKAALKQWCVRVGHNVDFDVSMLRNEFARAVAAGELCQEDAEGEGGIITLDTLALDMHLSPNATGRSLADVAGRWGVHNWQRHRAIGNADASIRILCNMSDHLPDDIGVVWEISKAEQVKRQAEMDKRRDCRNKKSEPAGEQQSLL